jgi:hypothetical protein
MARVMFDKANVQQRIGSLERAVDALGSSLKSDVSEMREELAFVRLLLEDVLHELREAGQGEGGSDITFPYKRGSSEVP